MEQYKEGHRECHIHENIPNETQRITSWVLYTCNFNEIWTYHETSVPRVRGETVKIGKASLNGYKTTRGLFSITFNPNMAK